MVLLFLGIAYTREKMYGYEKIRIDIKKTTHKQKQNKQKPNQTKKTHTQDNIYQLDRFSVQYKPDG